MSDNNESLSAESKKRIRDEAFKLAELRDKLEEARALAEQLHREPAASDYKARIEEMIEEISRTFARRIYFQSLRDMPWTNDFGIGCALSHFEGGGRQYLARRGRRLADRNAGHRMD